MTQEYEKNPNQHLYEQRTVFLTGDITTESAEPVVARLLVLDAIDPFAEIHLYVSSFGGGVLAGLAIYDAMHLVRAPVATTCIGPACSMAAWLLAAGSPGRRAATENSRIMLHSPSASLQGTTKDLRLAAQQVLDTEQSLFEILSRHTKLDHQEVARLCERDCWLTPARALELGLIDRILTPAKAPVRP